MNLRALGSICLLVCISLRAPGQEPVPPAGAIEELSTFYLKDEKGNLVPVPGLTYERLRELLLKESGSATDPPPFAIEELDLQGKVEGDVAQLVVQATIQIRKPGWVAVPLRMPKTALTGPVAGEKDQEIIHRYDAKEGHVVWLSGAKVRRHVLRFPLSARVQHVVGEQQLILPLPKASEAQLTLDLPGAIGDALLRAGDGLVQLAESEGRTRLTVTGAADDLTLAWRAASTPEASRLDIQATTEVAVTVETRDSVKFNARVQVARTGSAVSNLLVRLPPQTDLVSRTGRGFTAGPASAEEVKSAGIDPQKSPGAVIRVDLERPAELVEFTLEASYRPDAKPGALEAGGFEVLGAGRQTGHANIHLPPGWSLKAVPSAAVIRVDDAVPAGQPRPNARYRFVRQPYSLKIDAAPQPPRTVVEPTFFAFVEPQHVTLSATLEYQLRGPRPEYLEIDPADWTLDAAGPSSVVEIAPQSEPGKPVRLLLQPTAGSEFSVQLQLHQKLTNDSQDIGFGLPTAIASQRLPATLAVAMAENVAITPDADAIRSLIAESRPASGLPATGQRPLMYRELPAAMEPPRFAAGFQVRKRRVSAAIQGLAQIRGRRIDVEQQISLDIAYEPLAQLTLEAPADASLSNLTVSQDDELLEVREEALSGEAGTARRRWQVELPDPEVGKRQLTVRYRAAAGHEDRLTLSLVTPAEVEGVVVARQQLGVQSSGPLQYRLAASDLEDSATASESEQGLTISWLRRAAFVELERAPGRAALSEVLRVERQWLQTWLSPGARRDRFVAQISGVRDQLSLTLPSGVSPEDVRVLVDGGPPRSIELQDQTLLVTVDARPQQTRTWEVWYLLPGYATPSTPQRQVLDLPRVGRAAVPLQSWVQVVTPAADHVLYSPSAVTPQQVWRKRGLLWQRAGSLTTAELEKWSGATRAEEAPLDTSDALFMTLGPLHSLEVVVWGRRWLWVFVSGGVLLLGTVVHYLSRGRSLGLLALLAVAGLLGALVSPELALNISQFVGVGVLLLVAVMWSLRAAGKSAAPPPTAPTRGPEARAARRESSITRSVALVASAGPEPPP